MCRLLLHYHGDEFEDKHYVCDPAPEFDRSDWLSSLPKLPHCKKRRAELRMLNNQIMDFRLSFVMICYKHEYSKLIIGWKEKLPDSLRAYEEYLGDKKWLSGEHINFPDFNLCEFLNVLTLWDAKCLDSHPKLKEYLQRFENLPKIKEYMAGEGFKKRACNNKQAQWGASV